MIQYKLIFEVRSLQMRITGYMELETFVLKWTTMRKLTKNKTHLKVGSNGKINYILQIILFW